MLPPLWKRGLRPSGVLIQRWLVASYRRFGTACWFRLQSWSGFLYWNAWLLKMRPIVFFETSAPKWQSTLRNMPEERRLQFCTYLHFFFYWRCNPLWVCILQPSSGAIASSRTWFLDHIQWRATVGRTPLDKWSVRRDLYLTTHNTTLATNKHPCAPVGFDPTIAGCKRP